MACCSGPAASKGALRRPHAEESESLRRELVSSQQLNRKLLCKVEMLTSMVAMKDELVRSTDERFEALKWEVLHNFHGDDARLAKLAAELDKGGPGEVSTVAGAVLARRELFTGKKEIPRDEFARLLQSSLPEFRKDFLLAVADTLAPQDNTVKADAVLKHCEDAFLGTLEALVTNDDTLARAVRRASKAARRSHQVEEQRPATHHHVIPEAPPPPLPVEDDEQPLVPPPPAPAAAPTTPNDYASSSSGENTTKKKRGFWWRKKKPTTLEPSA